MQLVNATNLIRGIFSEEEKATAQQQLERLLASPFFSNSRRFPSFLRFVVEHTLAGQTDLLKERTLGIEIFGKEADYDTATDPIVRVTAAEIRKRIAQYYQVPGHERELRLSLTPGSYIPQFHWPERVGERAVLDPAEGSPAKPNVLPPSRPVSPLRPPAATAQLVIRRRSRTMIVAAATLFFIALIGAVIFAWKSSHRSAFSVFWEPILSSNDPVLFCIADQDQYSAIALRSASDPAHQIILKDNLTAVVIDDVSPIVKIAGVLQANGKKYSLRGEGATTLMDLRSGPTVFIGAFDNAWTLRLLKPLRYHFANNAEMTQFSIVDGNAPMKVSWTVDRTLQIATNNYRDYAIVARFTDSTTGKPSIVAAGIGRGGTIAAGEFITDPNLLAQIVRDSGSDQKNIELVLSTQIIDGEPGTPKVEATYFW